MKKTASQYEFTKNSAIVITSHSTNEKIFYHDFKFIEVKKVACYAL